MGGKYYNQKVGRCGVVFPFERCAEGELYSPPGPCTVRQMTPQERAKYGPPENKPVPFYLRAQYLKKRKKGDDRMQTEAVLPPHDPREARTGPDARTVPEAMDKSAPAAKPRRSRKAFTGWPEALTRDRYLQLKARGWPDKKIMLEYGIKGSATFYAWKKAQGLLGVTSAAGREVEPPAENCTVEGLTVAEVIALINDLRGEISACQALLSTAGIQLTDDLANLIRSHSDKCQAQIERISIARVAM